VEQTVASIRSKISKKKRVETPLESIVISIESGLSSKYQPAWDSILQVISCLFVVWISLYFLSFPHLNQFINLEQKKKKKENWKSWRIFINWLFKDS